MIISIPISILLGLFCGKMLNMAKGREMVTSYIISFFMNGLYQLVVLYMMGSIIPIIHSSIKLPRGYGVRNTVSLLHMRQYLDNLLAIHIGGVKIPVLTLIIIALLCLFIIWFRKTKLGQDMRAVGQDMDVAGDAGIKVERTRIIAIIMSTVFAGLGMVIYLQNMGNISTYSSHTQIGMFCIAALLVGGASVDRASIGNVFLGVILFHLMFIVAPKAGATITGDSMIGEYFRVFISYGVITVALIMYETKNEELRARLVRCCSLHRVRRGELRAKRTILFRIGAILLLLIIAGIMMVIGRGHTVYIDNKSIDYNGQTYTTPYKVVVYVDGEQVAKLRDKERGMATCIGQTFKMTLEITQEKGGSEEMVDVTVSPAASYGRYCHQPACVSGRAS